MREILQGAVKSRADWLERILERLVVSGTPLADIEIQEHPECRTRVVVRGQPLAEWRIEWPSGVT